MTPQSLIRSCAGVRSPQKRPSDGRDALFRAIRVHQRARPAVRPYGHRLDRIRTGGSRNGYAAARTSGQSGSFILSVLTNDVYGFFINSVDSSGGPGELTVTIVATSATPLPAALPLFATGLGALGLFGWRRKRKAAAPLAA
jgi:hypothetical protein